MDRESLAVMEPDDVLMLSASLRFIQTHRIEQGRDLDIVAWQFLFDAEVHLADRLRRLLFPPPTPTLSGALWDPAVQA